MTIWISLDPAAPRLHGLASAATTPSLPTTHNGTENKPLLHCYPLPHSYLHPHDYYLYGTDRGLYGICCPETLTSYLLLSHFLDETSLSTCPCRLLKRSLQVTSCQQYLDVVKMPLTRPRCKVADFRQHLPHRQRSQPSAEVYPTASALRRRSPL